MVLLRWAGSKRKLLDEILPLIPVHENYYEPFVGSGQVFFNKPKGLTKKQHILSDKCEELILFYQSVKHCPKPFIEQLEAFLTESKLSEPKSYYYQLRNLDRVDLLDDWRLVFTAARFYYLNQTCFNGLYRVNLRGQFNTPFGNRSFNYDKKKIIECGKVLSSVLLIEDDYTRVMYYPAYGDFVYLDPPYVPVSKDSFVNYNKSGFLFIDHIRLASICDNLDSRGVKFLLSNSDTPSVRELWGHYQIKTVKTYRSISAKSSARSETNELLISNY